MALIARGKEFPGAVAGLVAALSCCCVLATVPGCGQLTCDFDEEWRAARDPGSPQVNPENYERVEEGMKYEEVAAIFEGPGYFTMEHTLAGRTDKSYKWVGLDDYRLSVTFREGVVVRKAWWVTEHEDSEEPDSEETAAEEVDLEETGAEEVDSEEPDEEEIDSEEPDAAEADSASPCPEQSADPLS